VIDGVTDYEDHMLIGIGGLADALRCSATVARAAAPPSLSDGGSPQWTPFTEGRPSTPCWESGRLNQLTEWAVADETNRPIICEYQSDGFWLWTKWRGTVLSITILPVILSITFGVAVHLWATTLSAASWPLLSVPPPDDPLIQQLNGLNTLWEYQLTLSTFILTFFTSQAYAPTGYTVQASPLH
jgi:hypothetical protein